MPVNTQPNSGRFGQTFRVLPAPGGVVHVYPDGHREFVKAGAPSLAEQFTRAAQNTSTGPAAGNQAQWMAAAQATGTGPFAPAAAPAPSAAAAQPDGSLPLDAQYWAEKAARDRTRNDELSANEASGTANKSAFQEALRRLLSQRPRDEQGTREGANRQGLFFSGQLGKRLDDLATSYTRRQADQRSSYDAQERARIAARTAIENGYGADEAAALAAAADRQIPRDAAAADAGALVANPDTPQAPAAPGVPAVTAPKGFRTVTAHGWVYHVYPDGRRVPVRPVSHP